MTIRRFSSRTHRLDSSFLLTHLKGARSYKRIAGYFTSSLFEVANELLEAIPEVRIVCNVDIHPDDLKVAQLRESRMIGRWNEQGWRLKHCSIVNAIVAWMPSWHSMVRRCVWRRIAFAASARQGRRHRAG